MKISVIICAYNSEKTIEKCIRSVCEQTYDDLEIILVNDGSKDATLRIMQKYAETDRRIIIVDQQNMGAGLAKNVGLKKASGDFVTFVDSDDWIEKNTYECVNERIKQTDCDMVVFNYNRVVNNKVIKDIRPIKDETIDLDEMGRDTYIMRYIISYNHDLGACNKVVRNSIIKEHQIEFGDNKKFIYDDNLYSLKLLCHVKKISSLSASFYYYVQLPNSVSDMDRIHHKLAQGYTNLFEEYAKYLKAAECYTEIEPALGLLYYSMVYFGLIRLKHFGHYDVFESLLQLEKLDFYETYMKEIGKISVRIKYITQTLRKVDLLRNWQLTGLICLTIIQGKVVAHYALKGDEKKLNKFL